jgi:hypothetical protein
LAKGVGVLRAAVEVIVPIAFCSGETSGDQESENFWVQKLKRLQPFGLRGREMVTQTPKLIGE